VLAADRCLIPEAEEKPPKKLPVWDEALSRCGGHSIAQLTSLAMDTAPQVGQNSLQVAHRSPQVGEHSKQEQEQRPLLSFISHLYAICYQ
jgi:hypothetical protein